MKKIISILLIITVCLSLASCVPNLKKYAVQFADDPIKVDYTDAKRDDYVAFLEKLDVFSARLSASINTNRGMGQNYCISPVSVYMSLALAVECSSGETRDEILDALGMTYEEVSEFTKYLYAFCNREFTYYDGFGRSGVAAYEQLSNSIWVDDNLPIKLDGVNALAKNYNCDFFAANYRDGSAKDMINQYIEYKTHGVIKGNLDFSSDSVFTLINTFYLKEIWNTFGRNLVFSAGYYPFENFDGSYSDVRLLNSYYANGRVYETDYYSTFYAETEHGFKLHFIVPSKNMTIGGVFTEKTISEVLSLKDYGHIDHENKQLHYTKVLFPEFETSFSGSLHDIMSKDFGIESLFSADNCDLSGITDTDIYCKDLIHKSKLNVTASGIEGAAISAIQGATSPAPSTYEEVKHEFTINEAFGFVLTDSYGTVLFSGVVNHLN